MIIHSVHAENVLKYSRLDLDGLPDSGIIGISGQNESGKTAVVETICFALFGRTFSLPSDDIVKVIRWSETRCNVVLDFSLRGNERYQVERSLNSEGVHGATLKRQGERDPVARGAQAVHDAVVEMCGFSFQQYLDALYLAQREISAPHSQSDTIKAVAGGAELEQVAQDLHDDIEDERASIRDLDRDIEGIQDRIEDLGVKEGAIEALGSERGEWQAKIGRNDSEMDGLKGISSDLQSTCTSLQEAGHELGEADIDTSYAQWSNHAERLSSGLSSITNSCRLLETDNELCVGDEFKGFIWEFEGRLSAFDDIRGRARDIRNELARDLGEAVGEGVPMGSGPNLPMQLQSAQHSVARTTRWRWFARFNFLLLFVMTVASWAGWFLLTQTPSAPNAVSLAAWLEQYATFWQPGYTRWLFSGSLGMSLLSLFLLWRVVKISNRLRALQMGERDIERSISVARHRAELIDYMESMAFPQALESLDELEDEGLSRAVVAFAEGPGKVLLEQAALGVQQERMYTLLKKCEGSIGDLRESIATAIGGLDKENEQYHEEIARCDAAIKQEQTLLSRVQEHRLAIQSLEERKPPIEDEIGLLEFARELVLGTCNDLYARFNRVLREYTGEVMPSLTEGRYHHLQIDDSLEVKVFSNEKNDFAGLGELSSGTQRQIMLAVRLAMSKALTEAAVKGDQFVILDEPFAFFDRERIRSTLESLPKIDEKMRQIFIISQEFDDSSYFTVEMKCARGQDSLHMKAAK